MHNKIDIKKVYGPFKGCEVFAVKEEGSLYTIYNSEGEYIANVKLNRRKKESNIELRKRSTNSRELRCLDYLITALADKSKSYFDAIAVRICIGGEMNLVGKHNGMYSI